MCFIILDSLFVLGLFVCSSQVKGHQKNRLRDTYKWKKIKNYLASYMRKALVH